MRALLMLSLCLLSACHINKDPGIRGPKSQGPEPTLGAAWSLPGDWASMPPQLFEQLVLKALPETQLTPLSREHLERLANALNQMDASSVRAAVILGRSRTDAAGQVLLRRLFVGESGPNRNSDAGDVTAAGALARFPEPQRYWRLVRLVYGPRPHPDLEVRVECAVSALHAGIDRVIPFLLQVLRIGTPDGRRDALDFEVPETTAWARGRAAEALSRRAGVELVFHPDASLQARQAEVRKLAALLQSAIENATEVDYRKR